MLRDIARNPNQYLQQMSQRIFALSPDGKATRVAAELSANRNIANARANAIMQILRYDLDGDGTVTAAEIELQLPQLQPRERAQLTVKLLEADNNADQSLSLLEIVSAAWAEVDQSGRSTNGRVIDSIMAFDANADGRVDVAEVAAVLAAIDPADIETTRRLPTKRRRSDDISFNRSRNSVSAGRFDTRR